MAKSKSAQSRGGIGIAEGHPLSIARLYRTLAYAVYVYSYHLTTSRPISSSRFRQPRVGAVS